MLTIDFTKNHDLTLLGRWREKKVEGGCVSMCVCAKFSSAHIGNQSAVSIADKLRSCTICVVFKNMAINVRREARRVGSDFF